MTDDTNKLIIESIPTQQRANELMGKLFDITKPTAVYSQPVTQGEYTVITASELNAGIGFGYGGGGGFELKSAETEHTAGSNGAGGGGGGGGGSTARPVAAVIIGPDGVHVEPIIDLAKVAIAFFTTLGGIFMAIAKMRKFQKEGKLE